MPSDRQAVVDVKTACLLTFFHLDQLGTHLITLPAKAGQYSQPLGVKAQAGHNNFENRKRNFHALFNIIISRGGDVRYACPVSRKVLF